jgi:hypothetical protein
MTPVSTPRQVYVAALCSVRGEWDELRWQIYDAAWSRGFFEGGPGEALQRFGPGLNEAMIQYDSKHDRVRSLVAAHGLLRLHGQEHVRVVMPLFTQDLRTDRWAGRTWFGLWSSSGWRGMMPRHQWGSMREQQRDHMVEMLLRSGAWSDEVGRPVDMGQGRRRADRPVGTDELMWWLGLAEREAEGGAKSV